MIIDRRNKIDFLRVKLGTNGKPECDEYGELTGEYEVIKSGIWSSKDQILGNEYFSALTIGSTVEVKFNTRYMPEIDDTMRIRHGTKLYEILSAIDVKSMHRELLCYCRAVK